MTDGTYFTPPHLLRIADVTQGTGGALWRIACEWAQRLEPDAWIVAANPPFRDEPTPQEEVAECTQ